MQGGQSGQGAEQEWAAEGRGSGKGEMGDRQRRRGCWREDTLLGKTRHQGSMGKGASGQLGLRLYTIQSGFYLGASNTKHGACKLGGPKGQTAAEAGQCYSALPAAAGKRQLSRSRQPAWLHQTSHVRLAVRLRLAVLLRSAVHLHAALQPAGLACRVPAAGGRGRWRGKGQ